MKIDVFRNTRGFPTKKHHWTHIWNDYSKWRYIIHKWKKMFLKNFSRRFSTHIAALLSKKAQQTLNQPIRQNEDKHNFWSRAINNIYVESAKKQPLPIVSPIQNTSRSPGPWSHNQPAGPPREAVLPLVGNSHLPWRLGNLPCAPFDRRFLSLLKLWVASCVIFWGRILEDTESHWCCCWFNS